MQTNNQPPAYVIEFMNSVAQRIGPMNAVGLLKDAQITALRRVLVQELAVADEKIEIEMQRTLKETAQNILRMPVPSPMQIHKS